MGIDFILPLIPLTPPPLISISEFKLKLSISADATLYMILIIIIFNPRGLLAKRLLSGRSASDDMEKLMISKLKLRNGSQFTGKMEGMLTDLAIGSDHQAEFKRFCEDNNMLAFAPEINFSVQVLTTGYWPTYKTYDASLPPVMARCCQVNTFTFSCLLVSLVNKQK